MHVTKGRFQNIEQRSKTNILCKNKRMLPRSFITCAQHFPVVHKSNHQLLQYVFCLVLEKHSGVGCIESAFKATFVCLIIVENMPLCQIWYWLKVLLYLYKWHTTTWITTCQLKKCGHLNQKLYFLTFLWDKFVNQYFFHQATCLHLLWEGF